MHNLALAEAEAVARRRQEALNAMGDTETTATEGDYIYVPAEPGVLSGPHWALEPRREMGALEQWITGWGYLWLGWAMMATAFFWRCRR